MRNVARAVLIGLAVASGLAATAAIAGALAASEGDLASSAAPTCRKAEVNPVTGHVLCLDPIGAPVDPPPSAADVPCKPDARTQEAWSYGPKCKG